MKYALESLPEMLSNNDWKFLCDAIGINTAEGDSLRQALQTVIDDRASEAKRFQQEEYEKRLTLDENGWRNWNGWAYPDGPSAKMFPTHDVELVYLLIGSENIPTIEIVADTGETLRLSYPLINWRAVRKWRIVI